MLCSVIPYTRSIDDTLVTYELPAEFIPFVKVGSSVRVPWGTDIIIAIVASIGTEIPYEWQLKAIAGPHCTVPWLSPSEIALVLHLARQLFTRIHIIAQIFIPVGLFSLFERDNFLELTPPLTKLWKGEATYTIAPDKESMLIYLREQLTREPGLVSLPEGISVASWSEQCDIPAIADTHPKSLSKQRKIYLDILNHSEDVVFGTRRTLFKRIGSYQHIYVIHENLSKQVYYGLHKMPLWLVLQQLEQHGHIIHYLTTTPSIRTLTQFLQEKKSVQYL